MAFSFLMDFSRLGKKGDGGILSIGIFILVVFLIIFWIDNSTKECKRDSSCKENQYCGSDFSCHDFPAVKQAESRSIGSSGIVWAASLIAFGMIAAAIIFTKTNPLRWGKNFLPFSGGKGHPHQGIGEGQGHQGIGEGHPHQGIGEGHPHQGIGEGQGHQGLEHQTPEITPYYESVSESFSSSSSEEADEEGEFKHGHGAGH